MTLHLGKGNYINGQFIACGEQEITSQNPAVSFSSVFKTSTSISHVEMAIQAAKQALPLWMSLTLQDRIGCLKRLQELFIQKENQIALAITSEMGKILSESLLEAKNLSARIDLMSKNGSKRIETEHPSGILGETRYHAQGVLAVLGPYNFPAHLVNAHVIPALMTGNTVVVKFSDICPWVGEIYAQCMHEAGLPPGVFNLLQGGSDIGQALVKHRLIRGILFTGSFATGRTLAQAVLDEPHKMLALEMGGKNIAVVLKDASLYQALAEIVQGAFLTTGQRCTATSRVLIDKAIANPFIDSFIRIVHNLKPGDPKNPKTIFGPLASQSARDKFVSLLKNASIPECEALVKSQILEGGAFISPSLHLLKSKEAPGYIDTELFGPDVCIEIIDGIEEAIERTNESAYGLSNAIFTAKKSLFEKYYLETYSGVLNWNRSTNGAYGEQPFGGVGKSGNQRAAGIDAVRYTTYPVAVNYLDYAHTQPPANMIGLLEAEKSHLDISLSRLMARHTIEEILENYQIPLEDARGGSLFLPLSFLNGLSFERQPITVNRLVELLNPYVALENSNWVISIPEENQLHTFLERMQDFFQKLHNENYLQLIKPNASQTHIPSSEKLPRSQAMLRRLYCNNLVPEEKKHPVIDLHTSKGPYLSSIDEDPLIIFDAASQIASIGLGLQADAYLKALTENTFTESLLANNPETEESKLWIDRYSQLLLKEAWPGIQHATFTSAGAEANEKAFDLCRLNGPGGTRIIAFEGSFHGRTLMALQATYNPQKRTQFEFPGYEATFVPFPKRINLKDEPEITHEWITSWAKAKRPATSTNDPLQQAEIHSLECVRAEIEKGNICAVIVEPMQCEGGDNYATARFFNGLRALTRAFCVPLIFDEVQTGFGLLGSFYAHNAFNLRQANGQTDGPDCITLAKKAQLGVCLSVWPDNKQAAPHVLQIIRGYLQAKAILENNSPLANLKTEIDKQLLILKQQFADLVFNPRHQGYALAFDLPSHQLATQLINQRFVLGFMAYIAGEKTVRFRFNLSTTTKELSNLFQNLHDGLHFLKYGFFPKKPTAESSTQQHIDEDLKIEIITPELWSMYKHQIQKLEESTYEQGRRDSMDFLYEFMTQKDGLGLILTKDSPNGVQIVGYAIGGPLEHSQFDGPLQDKMRGKYNTFYSANIAVSHEYRNHGLGFKLKAAQMHHVRSMKNSDGSHRYHFITGRNRVGFTAEISRINHFFGAYKIDIYDHQYGERDAKALYYRIPLRRPKVSVPKSNSSSSSILDWSSSIQSPLGAHAKEILQDIENGFFTCAAASKLTLSNWVTPPIVRYAELLKHLMPKSCQHIYFTSGRDEVVDKGLRCLRVHRPGADIAIGLSRQFLGHVTAAARSLSDDSHHPRPFAWFDWPKVRHPAETSDEESLQDIQSQIEKYSANRILGIIIELIGEKSGYVVSDNFLNGLNQIRTQTSIPLIFVETVSSLGRNGKTLFKSDSLAIRPNMVWWYTGAQLGHVFVDHAHYVSTPLTLISTWDGDEVSIRRTYRHLSVAKQCLENQNAFYFENLIYQTKWTFKHHGQGLWHTFACQNEKQRQQILQQAKAHHLHLGKGDNHRIVFSPPINISKDEIHRGIEIFNHVVSQTSHS